MKKIGAALLLTTAMTTQPVFAEGWEFLPGTSDDYQSEMTVSALYGIMDPAPSGADSSGVVGVELALNCPLLKAPNGTIRQQASLTRYDEDGVELTTIEINPHYLVEMSDRLALGFGPGLGYLKADATGVSDGVFALQAGVSLHYNMDRLFIGAEARYQWTQEIDDTNDDMNNSRIIAKVGYRF